MRLETIEDFRRVAKALQDLESTPQQYVVEDPRGFGYCTFCRDITPCESDGNIEGYNDHCKGCGRDFGTFGLDDNLYVTEVLEMPASAAKKLEKLKIVSRKQQTKLFLKLLKRFVAAQEAKVKEDKRNYRAAAKGVGKGKKLLASFV